MASVTCIKLQICLMALNRFLAPTMACGECGIERLPKYDAHVIDGNIWSMITPYRVSCLWECYRHPRCKSFQHDDLSGVCRGYDTFLNDRWSYTGSPQEEHAKTYIVCSEVLLPQVHGTPCDMNHGCYLANTTCIDNACICNPGLIYHPTTMSCDVYCQSYSNQFSVYPRYYADVTSATVHSAGEYVADPDECRDLCLEESNFVCIIAVVYESTGSYWCVYGTETWEMPAAASMERFPKNDSSLYIRHCS